MKASRAFLLKGSWEAKTGVEATAGLAVEAGVSVAAEAVAAVVVGVILVVFVYYEFRPEYLDVT